MQIIHRLVVRTDSEDAKRLRRAGVAIGSGVFEAVDIVEGSALWLELTDWISSRGLSLTTWSEFADEESAAANWFWIRGPETLGFPQPEPDQWGYMRTTYDSASRCSACGEGKTQVQSFQIASEPDWTTGDFAQLSWIADELFMRRKSFDSVLAPLGVSCRPVLGPGRRELSTVVQLQIDDQIELDIAMGLGAAETCTACGRQRYPPLKRGPYPAPIEGTDALIGRTVQRLGSGALSFSLLVGSKALVQAIRRAGIAGLETVPLGIGQTI